MKWESRNVQPEYFVGTANRKFCEHFKYFRIFKCMWLKSNYVQRKILSGTYSETMEEYIHEQI